MNLGLLDGSVRFVSDSVNVGSASTYNGVQPVSGESPFGIWGAMGTPSGGESKSL